jgi:hypothetical protein
MTFASWAIQRNAVRWYLHRHSMLPIGPNHHGGAKVLRSVIAALVAVGFAVPVSAQVPWDAPPLVSSVSPAGVSLFLLRADGGRLGGLVTLRHDAGPVGLGYRLAVTEEAGPKDIALAAGVDISGLLSRGVEGAPVDVVWWSGAGVGHGDETLLSIPLGLLVGWSGSGDDGVIFSPYAGGHVALDESTADNDSVDFQGAIDLGADIVMTSGWMLRFGATIGSTGRDALALGAKLPT